MKRNYTISLFVLAIILSTGIVHSAWGQTSSKLPERIVTLNWNLENQRWDTTRSSFYQYDNSGRVASDTTHHFRYNNVVRIERDFYGYNNDGYLLEYTKEKYQNGEWISDYRFKTEYDKYNNILSSIAASWSGSKWDTSEISSVKYDLELNDINQVVVRILYHFDYMNSRWWIGHREVFTYNIDGSVNSSTLSIWGNNTWREFKRSVNIVQYNETNKTESQTDQEFIDDKWLNSSRVFKTYLALEKQTSYIQEAWIDTISTWQRRMTDSITYDSYQNPILRSIEAYNFQTNKLELYNETRYTYEYNDDNSIKTAITEYRNADNSEWVKSEKKLYFYSVPTGILQQDLQNDIINIFPNPTSESIFISNAEGEILLFNQLGQKVWSGTGFKNNVKIDVSQLPAGHYILKTESPKGVQSQKLIIAR